MEASATVEISSFVAPVIVPTSEISSFVAAAFVATAEAITIVPASEIAIPAIIEIAATVKPRTAIKIPGAAIKAVEPWAGADKNASGEVTRPVVAVRRAPVRIISIVTVLAHRGWTYVGRANANADHDSLRMCVRHCHQANPK